MAKKNRNSFIKRQKEMERMRKAQEKMARRHGKKDKEEEPERVDSVESFAHHLGTQ